MNNMTVRVFISHASEDKERFVIKFSEYLMQNGIDVWLDKWEMLPGDSLIDKIFEEGLKQADAVIVILSKYSIQKKWVREELNAALVKRINKNSKLIPVILDNLEKDEIPQALQNTVWQKIDDINNYSVNADIIIASLLNRKLKPDLGRLPNYASPELDLLPGLTKIDTLVLKVVSEIGISDGYLVADSDEIFMKLKQYDIPLKEIIESIKILDGRFYIKASWHSEGFSHALLTVYGFQEYAKAYVADYDKMILDVASILVNSGDAAQGSNKISDELRISLVFVNHILDLFEHNGYLTQQKMTNNMSVVYNISPELKRSLS